MTTSTSTLKDRILLAAIKLSGGQHRNFSDLELSSELGYDREQLLSILKEQKLEELRQTKKSEIVCKCGNEISIYEGMKLAYCRCGKEINDIPYWNFGVNIDAVTTYLKTKIMTLLQVSDMVSDEGNKFVILYKGYKLAFIVRLEKVNLNDIYILKGWAVPKNPDFHIIVGNNPEFTLSSQGSKGTVGVVALEELFDVSLFGNEMLTVEQNIVDERKELSLNLPFKESKDLIEIERFWQDIINNIERFSLQIGPESAKRKGESFQEQVVDLLRITIFDAKYIGGKNCPDGSIFLKATTRGRQGELIPLEIKSDKTGIVHLQEHEAQVRKYLEAFTNSYVTDRFSVSHLMVFGHDFDLNNKKDTEVIRKLEEDFSIRIVLFPLTALIRLVNKYFQLKISGVDNDIIVEFLGHSYISTDLVDDLMDKLKVETENKNKDIYNKITTILKSRGYK